MKNTVKPARQIGEVWTRREGDETAIFNPSSRTLIRLNSSALAIWELCDGETEMGEMVDAVVELTGRDKALVAGEVAATLTQLRDLGLVI